MNWRENDLKVSEMREKIIELTEKFNEKNGTEILSYQKKLNLFLDRKLKKESNILLAEHFSLTISGLNSLSRKV